MRPKLRHLGFDDLFLLFGQADFLANLSYSIPPLQAIDFQVRGYFLAIQWISLRPFGGMPSKKSLYKTTDIFLPKCTHLNCKIFMNDSFLAQFATDKIRPFDETYPFKN